MLAGAFAGLGMVWGPPQVFASKGMAFRNSGSLPRVFLDVERSLAEQDLITRDGIRFSHFPEPAELLLPPDLKLPLKKWAWNPASQKNSQAAQLVIRGMDPERPTTLVAVEDRDFLTVNDSGQRESRFGLMNIDLKAGPGGDAFRPTSLNYLYMSHLRIEGGRNCMLLPSYPMVAEIEHCDFYHGGRGDGYTHNVYVNYVQEVHFRQCRFYAPRRLGHVLKSYGAFNWIEDCYFSSFETFEDQERGFTGELPILDLGAWGNSIIRKNRFVRRPPARNVVIDYRNRQWRSGKSKYAPPEWGTSLVPAAKIDNGRIDNPHLFHHILEENIFENGVMPDGRIYEGRDFPKGAMARLHGTSPWNSHGDVEEGTPKKPSGWQAHQERALLWHRGNEARGLPFEKNFITRDIGYYGLAGLVRSMDADEKAIITRILGEKYRALKR